MRLWHYKIIPYLPNSQLIAQWRELNLIYAKDVNHILINYYKEYPKEELLKYSDIVINELLRRKVKINKEKYNKYFDKVEITHFNSIFENHHDNEYLTICYYNLLEKYLRGQKDFSQKQFWEMYNFWKSEKPIIKTIK